MSEKQKLYGTQAAADRLFELGRGGRTGGPLRYESVRYLALRYEIGQKVSDRLIFTDDDIESLLALPGPGGYVRLPLDKEKQGTVSIPEEELLHPV